MRKAEQLLRLMWRSPASRPTVWAQTAHSILFEAIHETGTLYGVRMRREVAVAPTNEQGNRTRALARKGAFSERSRREMDSATVTASTAKIRRTARNLRKCFPAHSVGHPWAAGDDLSQTPAPTTSTGPLTAAAGGPTVWIHPQIDGRPKDPPRQRCWFAPNATLLPTAAGWRSDRTGAAGQPPLRC